MKRFTNAKCFRDGKYKYTYAVISLPLSKLLKVLKKFKISFGNYQKNISAGTFIQSQSKQIVFVFPKILNEFDLVEACAHEAYHATRLILNELKINIKDPSDEKGAYLLGYITKNLYDVLK